MSMATKQWRRAHKEDLLQYSREWYKRNSQRVIQNKMKRRQETKEWLRSIKEKLKCECGQSHIACLIFHHLDPKKKDIKISDAVHNGWSKERILKEIEKCKVMCANCHAILHWNERYGGIDVIAASLPVKESVRVRIPYITPISIS